MSSKLIPELLCQQCLRNFSKYDHLGQAKNIKLSRPALLSHQRTCSLRYSNPILGQENPIVYCIAPNAPMDERRRAFHTAQAMYDSDEVPGDIVGWYHIRECEVYAFLPVSNGQVTGFVIVRKRLAAARKSRSEGWEPAENSPHPHWCIDKIWIYEPHRRKGIASSTVRAIAQYFGESAENLGWLWPLTPEGTALACALSGEAVYLAM
jgi:GNAT superfamily N-acetyltransferase